MNEVYSLPGRNQRPVADAPPVEEDICKPAVRDIRDLRPGLREGIVAEGLDRDLTSKLFQNLSQRLSPNHRRMLFEESGLDEAVALERGYRTISKCRDVPKLFRKKYQRKLGLCIPMFSPDGVSTSFQMRPNIPRKDRKTGKGIKYETPHGGKILVDVHPRNFESVRDASVDLWITEGVKKGDALTSHGLCALSLIGVNMYAVKGSLGKDLLPCFDHIPLEGRRVNVVFDSDVMTKPEVNLALERLEAALKERGAIVRVVYIPDIGKDKTGVDDFLASGGENTLEALESFATTFEPSEFSKIRLSRNERLRLAMEYADERYRAIPWKGMGGKSASNLATAILNRAARNGKLVKGKDGEGISVIAPWGPLQIEAGIGSSRTVGKAFKRLEDWGFGYLDHENRKAGEAGRFVIRASVKQFGKELRPLEGVSLSEGGVDRTTLHLRSPHEIRESVPAFRWSKPGRKGLLGVVKGTRKVRLGPKPEAQDRIIRLGKTRGAVVEELVMAGGVSGGAGTGLTLEELAARMHVKRPRDLRRRTLPMLEDAGIIRVEDDFVSLTGDWESNLEAARDIGGEIEALEVALKNLEIKRKAYRSRNDVEPTPHWTQRREVSGKVEDLERVEDILETGLSEEDTRAFEAIQRFEGEYGRGSFLWNRAGAKELFYQIKPGIWPEDDQLKRIRDYLDLKEPKELHDRRARSVA